MAYVVRFTRMLHLSPSYIVTAWHKPLLPFRLRNSGANRCPQNPSTILTHFTSLRHIPLSFRTSSEGVVPGQDRTHNLWSTQKRLCWGGYQCKIHGSKGLASSGTLACISMGYVVRLTRMLHVAMERLVCKPVGRLGKEDAPLTKRLLLQVPNLTESECQPQFLIAAFFQQLTTIATVVLFRSRSSPRQVHVKIYHRGEHRCIIKACTGSRIVQTIKAPHCERQQDGCISLLEQECYLSLPSWSRDRRLHTWQASNLAAMTRVIMSRRHVGDRLFAHSLSKHLQCCFVASCDTSLSSSSNRLSGQ
jgi:hypothetical protein